VDHVGHTFGANHVEMKAKLKDMNHQLVDIVNMLHHHHHHPHQQQQPAPAQINLSGRSSHLLNHTLVDHHHLSIEQDHPTTTTTKEAQRKTTRNPKTDDDDDDERSSSAVNSTLLLLFGDHGMTEEGNHGGATRDETDAAFFAWVSDTVIENKKAFNRRRSSEDEEKEDLVCGGKRKSSNARWNERNAHQNNELIQWDEDTGFITKFVTKTKRGGSSGFDGINDSGGGKRKKKKRRRFSQLDLVPTLSLLLGIPIPYSNVGGIIPELFMLHQVVDPFFEHQGED
jgi:hypothetical protein